LLNRLKPILLSYAKIGAVDLPKLHTYGERTSSTKYMNRYGQVMTRQIWKHRFRQWREEDSSKMDMAATVGNHFVHNTAKE
jgi:hypothetical protein